MSNIGVRIEYNNQLWLNDMNSNFTFNWNQHTVSFANGVHISTEIKLDLAEKKNLVKSLTFDNPSHIPHWQNLIPDLHKTVERILKQIQEVAKTVDSCIRQTPKGIRLEPLNFERKFLNQTQSFPVVYWKFTEEERRQLSPIYEHFDDNAKKTYDKGIMIPMPVSFERRQILLTDNEVKDIGDTLNTIDNNKPYLALYSIAWQNFSNHSFDSAILILATSIETSLKWWLNQEGDEIAKFLISNMQSPPLEELYKCARNNTNITLPGIFTDWLVRLRKARNDIAHKPSSGNINPLEIARWFAVAEAIFKSFSKFDNNKLVGYLVEPKGKDAHKKFHSDSKGIVLRQEKLGEEHWLHVLLDTEETYRFGLKSCKKCKEQNFS